MKHFILGILEVYGRVVDLLSHLALTNDFERISAPK